MIAAALAALAATAPTPLGPAPNAGFALAGDHALLANVDPVTENQLRVSAVPLTGGAAAPVFALDGPPDTWVTLRLAASATRAAATIEVEPEDGDQPTTRQMVTGPALGPWTAVAPPASAAPYPLDHRVDGDRIFTTELREPQAGFAVVARDPDPHDVPVTGLGAAIAAFAGDLMAYPATKPGDREDDLGRRLVIADWRTGAIRRTVDLPGGFSQLALRADGRVAVVQEDPGTLFDIRPDRPPKPYRVRAESPRFAGDHVVFTDTARDRPYVLDPDGTVRPFGAPTQSYRGFVADDTHVAWIANDCLLVAPVTARVTDPPGPGPCSRGEVEVAEEAEQTPKFARTIPARLHCVTAPTRCKGTVNLVWTQGDTVRTTLKVTSGTRFSIPTKRTRTVRIRLNQAGHRALRAHFKRHRRATLAVEPVSDGGARLPDYARTWMQIRG